MHAPLVQRRNKHPIISAGFLNKVLKLPVMSMPVIMSVSFGNSWNELTFFICSLVFSVIFPQI